MSTQQIGEILSGTVNGVNKVFTASHIPDENTLLVYDNGNTAAQTSVNGAAVTLVSPPTVGHQVFGVYLLTSADSIDLTTLAAVKSFGEFKTTTEDNLLQAMITAFSQYVLDRTGRRSFNSIVAYTDSFNGNGRPTLWLNDWPVTGLTQVIVNGATQILSTGPTVPGIVIGPNQKSIGFAYGSFGLFSKGFNNISVAYTAGYSSTPDNLAQACCEAVVLNSKRRAWTDMRSKSIGTGGSNGTTSYQDWELPPHVDRIINQFTRTAVLS